MRYLLAIFFFIMYAGDNLGLNISLGPGMSIKNVFLYIMLVGIAVNAAVARNRHLDLLSVLIPFGLLIFYALLTWIAVSFILDYPDYSMRQSFIVLKSSLGDQLFTFLVFFFGVRTSREAFWLLKAIIWIAVVGNIITLVDAFNIPNLGIVEARMRDERFLGFIGSANGYGQFCVLFLAPAVALFLNTSGKVKALAAVGLFSTALALLLTGSRGSYVGLIVGSIASSIYLRRVIPTERLLRSAVLGASLLGVLLAILLFAGYSDLFLERFSRFGGSSHVATSGRSTIWTTALAVMMEKPLTFIFGYGFNVYESSREFYAATHNMYLTYLFNLGTIGLVLYLTVFWRVLATVRGVLYEAGTQGRDYLVGMIFGLSGFLVAIFFSEYHSSGYLLWGYLGVAMRFAMQSLRGAEAGEMAPIRDSKAAAP